MYRAFGPGSAAALISLAFVAGGIGCSGEIGAANRSSGGTDPSGKPIQGGTPTVVDPAVLAALPWPIQSQPVVFAHAHLLQYAPSSLRRFLDRSAQYGFLLSAWGRV